MPDITELPSAIIEQMRAWFFAKDRSIILPDNAFVEGEDTATPANPISNRGRMYWKQDQNGAWYQLDSSGNEYRLANGYVIIQDQKTAGTNGGTFTSGAWRTRDLTTTIFNNIGAGYSLSSNQFTLPAGTYIINAKAPAYNVSYHALRLRNITDGTTDIDGNTSQFHSLAAGNTRDVWAFLTGFITISGSKVYELQHRCSVTSATSGFGFAINASVPVNFEIYSTVEVIKIA